MFTGPQIITLGMVVGGPASLLIMLAIYKIKDNIYVMTPKLTVT